MGGTGAVLYARPSASVCMDAPRRSNRACGFTPAPPALRVTCRWRDTSNEPPLVSSGCSQRQMLQGASGCYITQPPHTCRQCCLYGACPDPVNIAVRSRTLTLTCVLQLA